MITDIKTKRLYFAALVAMIAYGILSTATRHAPQFHPDLMDGLRGLFIGVFIGGMGVTVWRNGRRPAQ